jgi:hypothetical protein
VRLRTASLSRGSSVLWGGEVPLVLPVGDRAGAIEVAIVRTQLWEERCSLMVARRRGDAENLRITQAGADVMAHSRGEDQDVPVSWVAY